MPQSPGSVCKVGSGSDAPRQQRKDVWDGAGCGDRESRDADGEIPHDAVSVIACEGVGGARSGAARRPGRRPVGLRPGCAAAKQPPVPASTLRATRLPCRLPFDRPPKRDAVSPRLFAERWERLLPCRLIYMSAAEPAWPESRDAEVCLFCVLYQCGLIPEETACHHERRSESAGGIKFQ